MDLPSFAPVITKLLEQGVLVVILLYAVVTLYKKLLETQEKRVTDSSEREKTITIALNTVAQTTESNNQALQEFSTTMKAIMISLEHKNGKH